MSKVALIQLTSTDKVDENVAVVSGHVSEAAQAGALLICLPENAFYFRAESGSKFPDFDTQTHPGVLTMQELAKQHSVFILIGSVALTAEGGKIANASLLIDSTGEISARYDKIHLFDVDVKDSQGSYRESDYTQAGNKAVVADTPAGTLGMSICYDMRFPELYTHLAQRGAEILAMPSAFTKVTGEAHWHVLLRARAIETGCYVIAPAQVGTHPGGRQTYGHSLVVDPWGQVIAEAGEKDSIIFADINLDNVRNAHSAIPALQHRRSFS